MSSSPEDFTGTNVEAVSGPNVWTLGYIEDAPGGVKFSAVRPLTDEEYSSYRSSLDFVIDRREQAAPKLVMGNYSEFRGIQTWMATIFTTTDQTNWPDTSTVTFNLRRILLNWLNSIRLLDDHTIARFKTQYGDCSAELTAYNVARAEAYDNVFAYRFVCQLRHYAQHCGEVPVQAQIFQDAVGTRLSLHFDRTELLAKFNNWKRVKQDLQSGPEKIELDTIVESAMEAVVKLAQTVAKIDAPRFQISLQAVQDVLSQTPNDETQRPSVFRMRTSTDETGAPKVDMEIAPVLLVTPSGTDEEPRSIDIPDFRSDRPIQDTKKSTRRCQGPLNKATEMPAEACSARATKSLMFAHQAGMAFLFACDQHALALGQWAGKRFGGCFGGEAEKADAVRRMAAERSVSIEEPHGSEFLRLLPAPGAPQPKNPFSDL